jgi:hypothetical protein
MAGFAILPFEMKRFFILSAVLTVGSIRTAWACDICSVYSATEAQGGAGAGFFAGVAEQFTRFGSLQIDGQTAANDGEHINSFNSQVFVGYNFNGRFGLQLNLPVIHRDYSRQFTSVDDGHTYSPQSHSQTGLGDLSLVGNFRAYEFVGEQLTFNWTLLGGIKLPTGGTGELNPANPDFATGIGGHDLTFGSGSVDGIVGTGFSARWEKVFLAASMQYSIRSSGAFDYQYANDWTWSGGPGVYLLLNERRSLTLQAIVSGESKGADTAQGVATDDSSVTSVFLGPQISFTWSDKISIQAGADLPVSIATTGNQLVPDYRIHGAVTWRF